MDKFHFYIPLVIPILVIQLVLMIAALVDIAHRSQTHGQKWIWVLVIVLINFIGPIIYFVAGRKEE